MRSLGPALLAPRGVRKGKAGIDRGLFLFLGTPIDNKMYCEKDGSVIFEDGNIKLCGRGNQERRLIDIQQLIDDN